MAEHEHVELIDAAFAVFRTPESLGVPAGPDAARATVQHRRRVRAVTVSLAAVLAVATPIAAYAVTGHNQAAPPVIGTSVDPSTSPTASTGGSTAASATA